MRMDREKFVAVKSADRVLDLLELLSRKAKPMSHTEIALALGIPKSSLTQLLRNLAGRGYLELAPGTNSYALGSSFFALLRQGRGEGDVIATARKLLERLTAATHESSAFGLYRKDYVERVCGVDSPQALTYRMTPGTRFQLYSSSIGKAVLAALPEGERERYLARVKLVPETDATVKSLSELRRQLTKAAKEGIAYSHGEHMPGVVAIAVAVRRADGYPIGAINVAIPSIRYEPSLKVLCVRELLLARSALERELPDDFSAAK
jgi:DNA-binding IclR family transcriptional regulator